MYWPLDTFLPWASYCVFIYSYCPWRVGLLGKNAPALMELGRHSAGAIKMMFNTVQVDVAIFNYTETKRASLSSSISDGALRDGVLNILLINATFAPSDRSSHCVSERQGTTYTVMNLHTINSYSTAVVRLP